MQQLGKFTGTKPVLFNISTTRAIQISPFSCFPKEGEVLIIPPIQFTVSNITTLNDVTFVEIAEDSAFPLTYLSKPDGRFYYEQATDLFLKGKYNEAYPYFSVAADNGYPPAYTFLGIYFSEGYIGTKDDHQKDHWFGLAKKHLTWFKENSSSTEPVVQYSIGFYYAVVENDYNEAVLFYLLAAEQGYPLAQYNLGVCYSLGRGVTQDYKNAVKYFELAAVKGHTEANFNLLVEYTEGKDDTQDSKVVTQDTQEETLEKFLDEPQIQFALGKAWSNKKDYKKAVDYFQLAANQGYSHALNELGVCYYHGNGVTQDFQEAVKYFKLAADQDNPQAQTVLGLCFVIGCGVTQDIQEAKKYLQLAADKGDTKAREVLERLSTNSN